MRLLQKIDRLLELPLPEMLDATTVQLKRVSGQGRQRADDSKINSGEPDGKKAGADMEK
jgi:hypothetical protein